LPLVAISVSLRDRPIFRLLSRPPVACLVLAAVLTAAALPLATGPAIDMDIWWIAAAGRRIFESGRAPHTNMFSFVEPDHPWVMHEWLYGLIFDRGTAWLGAAFFSCFAFLSACTTSAVVLFATLGRARHAPSAALFSGVVLLGVLSKLDSPRPLYASAVFATTMAALAFADRFKTRDAVVAVLVEWIWANAHGSFPAGVALLLTGAWAEREDRTRRVAAAALAGLVTLANPYGAEIYGLVARYARPHDQAAVLIHSHLGGFMPLWRAPAAFVDGGTLVAFATVAGAALVCAARRDHAFRGILALCATCLGALHVRHLVLGLVVSSVLLAPGIDAWFARTRGSEPSHAERWRRMLSTIAPPFVFGLLAFSWKCRATKPDDWIPPPGGPAFVRLADSLPSNARVHTSFSTSGLLLWLAAPRGVRVLYDARNDCYSAELVAAGFALDAAESSREDLRAILERFGADHAILPDANPLAEALVSSEGWAIGEREDHWILFRRRAR
jgi:hypothetical protein